ncbi:MAG TPA: helix-turn-helix domain-containing protein [Longimicrobium sp.]
MEDALDFVRKRWKASVVLALASGCLRFGELHASLPTVAHKVLSEVLREMAADGLIVRSVRAERRKHVEYSLTSAGEALLPVLQALNAWGAGPENLPGGA